ncbi:MAG: type IV toxin-antitoxin system AbiEi family antitoxin domain-containing protein [Ilumatobacteraceae bacterium]
MTPSVRPLRDVATGQFGTVTRAQLHAAGYSRSELRRQIQSGVLEQTGAHTFRSPLQPVDMMHDLGGLLVDCGPEAWASGPTAAALHGMDGYTLRPPFHVTVMRGRNVQRARHRIHTTTFLPPIDRCIVDGVACTSAARTLIDLSRTATRHELTVALDSALRDGRTSEAALHRRIARLRARGRFGIPKLLDVIEGIDAARGGHSWLERRYLDLLAEAGLPRPDTQAELARTGDDRLVRVDCRFPGTPVVVELLGYRWHRDVIQMARDAERLNALLLEGLQPLQFTYRQVTTAPRLVVATTRTALAPYR